MLFVHSLERYTVPSRSTDTPQVQSSSASRADPPSPPLTYTSVARDAGDDAGLVVDSANGVIAQVGKIQVAVAVLVQVMGVSEPRFDGRATVTRITCDSISCECLENTVLVDPPDPVPKVVDHDQFAVGPACDAHGPPGVSFLRRDPGLLSHASQNREFSDRQAL